MTNMKDMERITEKGPDGHWRIKRFTETLPAYWQACNRLAAYEDTGMTPEEVSEMASPEVVEIARLLSNMLDEGSDQHMVELFEAEKEGRLVVLPCQPDAPFYQWKKGDDCPSISRFEGVEISEDGEIIYPMKRWGETFTLDDFGKTVFLTRKEAEATLTGQKEDANGEDTDA